MTYIDDNSAKFYGIHFDGFKYIALTNINGSYIILLNIESNPP